MYPPLTTELARAYQDELSAAAKPHDTLPAANSANPHLQERVLLRVGNLLYSTGLKLRERYDPALCCGPEAYRSAAGKARI